jgi:hypothetical protein
VEEHILKKASTKQPKSGPAGGEEGPSKAPMPAGLHKLRGMVRDTWRYCRWTSHQLFELREDMNRFLRGCPLMPCTIPLLSSLTFQSTLLVRMRARRSLLVPWLKTHLLPTLMEMKKMMSH